MIGTVRGTTRMIKQVAGLPAPIASFTTNIKSNIPELSVAVNPVQSGSGDPAPDNIRPIIPVSSIHIYQNEVPMTNWYAIRQVVRAGLAPTFYPVGTEFVVHKTVGSDTLDLTFRVVDHDKLMPTGLNHSMVLESKYVYSGKNGTVKYVVFDGPEAMFYCESALSAGTYNFTWDYATGQMVNGTYEFTLTQSVPAGGQIVLGTNSSSTAITSCKISTYATTGSTTAIESNIAVSSGSSGTSLGTISSASSTNTNLNCAQRILWGSNNFAQSGLLQWLNSDKVVGSVWKATNKFDRPTSWATSSDIYYAGFINGLDEDFANSVVPAKIPCRTNSLFEVESLDGTTFTTNQTYDLSRKFFILSRPEVYGSWDSSSIKDGEVLDFYEDAENADRIKRDTGGTARWVWLRSPTPSGARGVRVVSIDGSLGSDVASSSYSVAPACIIG